MKDFFIANRYTRENLKENMSQLMPKDDQAKEAFEFMSGFMDMVFRTDFLESCNEVDLIEIEKE